MYCILPHGQNFFVSTLRPLISEIIEVLTAPMVEWQISISPKYFICSSAQREHASQQKRLVMSFSVKKTHFFFFCPPYNGRDRFIHRNNVPADIRDACL